MATTPVPMSYGEAEATDAEAAAENTLRDEVEREYEAIQAVVHSSSEIPAASHASFHVNGSRAAFSLRPCLDVHLLQVTGGTSTFSLFAGIDHLTALRDALDEYLGDSHRVHVVVVDKGSV